MYMYILFNKKKKKSQEEADWKNEFGGMNSVSVKITKNLVQIQVWMINNKH